MNRARTHTTNNDQESRRTNSQGALKPEIRCEKFLIAAPGWSEFRELVRDSRRNQCTKAVLPKRCPVGFFLVQNCDPKGSIASRLRLDTAKCVAKKNRKGKNCSSSNHQSTNLQPTVGHVGDFLSTLPCMQAIATQFAERKVLALCKQLKCTQHKGSLMALQWGETKQDWVLLAQLLRKRTGEQLSMQSLVGLGRYSWIGTLHNKDKKNSFLAS